MKRPALPSWPVTGSSSRRVKRQGALYQAHILELRFAALHSESLTTRRRAASTRPDARYTTPGAQRRSARRERCLEL